MKYYIIAGEASGDLHGSNLMKGIYAEDPQADIRFWGGDLMAGVWNTFQDRATPLAAGGRPNDEVVEGVVLEGASCDRPNGLVLHYKEGAVMGFVEVLA